MIREACYKKMMRVQKRRGIRADELERGLNARRWKSAADDHSVAAKRLVKIDLVDEAELLQLHQLLLRLIQAALRIQ
jgi:hypothetical protein